MNRLVLLLTGIVLVGIAGFSLVWFSAGRELQAPTAKLLIDLRDGASKAVYERAHPLFRERWSGADLDAYWRWWGEELGTFFEIVARRDVMTTTKDGATHSRLVLELGFMQGKARGAFEFLMAEPDPLLTHFRISRLDEGEGAAGDREELVARVRALLTRYDEQDWVGLYAALSFELQKDWPLSRLSEQMTERRAATGKLVSLRLANSSDDGNVVTQDFEVEYERTKGSAKIVQRFADGRWHIDFLHLGQAR